MMDRYHILAIGEHEGEVVSRTIESRNLATAVGVGMRIAYEEGADLRSVVNMDVVDIDWKSSENTGPYMVIFSNLEDQWWDTVMARFLDEARLMAMDIAADFDGAVVDFVAYMGVAYESNKGMI